MVNMCNEIWKDVLNLEGYQVSNMGKARYIDYNSGKLKIKKFCVSKDSSRSDHYLRAIITKNGKPKIHSLHRMVAKTFMPNPNSCVHIRFKNGDFRNCSLENLEWKAEYINIKNINIITSKTNPTRIEQAITNYINKQDNTIYEILEQKRLDIYRMLKKNYLGTNSDEIEDAVHQAIINVIISIKRGMLLHPERLLTWFYVIAKNCLIDELRRKKHITWTSE